MSNTYYQDELQYLREVGPDFARANPEIARYLSDRGSNPDVERILEGVAFLCGRIRQKLDDELPELTASVMSLLWPHYLRPIPSMTILELLPEIDAMQACLEVPAGTEFASIPIDGTRCRYRSCWPLVLRPWSLADVRLETVSARPMKLVMTFRSAPKSKLEDLQLGSLRLHLAGEPRTACELYLLLAAHVDHITVSDGSTAHSRPERRLTADHVAPAGLQRSEAVLPYPSHSFPGYRLLQEYFAFKSRFLFIDFLQLDKAVAELELKDTMEIAVTFNRRLESPPLVSPENIRPHCVPIINLFEHPADPIRLRHDRTEYLIQPSKSGVEDRRHLEVFAVERVQGLVRSDTVQSREYWPFYSFEHRPTRSPGQSGSYFQTRVVPSVLGGDPSQGTDTYVSLVSTGNPRDLPDEESISIELTCTNRHLPNELRAGDITERTDSSPANARFRNLLKPTSTVRPPLGRQLHWRLISHMSLNYVSLAETAHFKELLRIYDFQSEHDAQRAVAHQRLLDGILSIRSSFSDRMVRGSPLRGTQIELELHEDHFAGEGDAYVFATVLDRFFGLYTSLNAYTQLNVKFAHSGQRYSFPARWGEQITPAESRT